MAAAVVAMSVTGLVALDEEMGRNVIGAGIVGAAGIASMLLGAVAAAAGVYSFHPASGRRVGKAVLAFFCSLLVYLVATNLIVAIARGLGASV